MRERRGAYPQTADLARRFSTVIRACQFWLLRIPMRLELVQDQCKSEETGCSGGNCKCNHRQGNCNCRYCTRTRRYCHCNWHGRTYIQDECTCNRKGRMHQWRNCKYNWLVFLSNSLRCKRKPGDRNSNSLTANCYFAKCKGIRVWRKSIYCCRNCFRNCLSCAPLAGNFRAPQSNCFAMTFTCFSLLSVYA